MKTALIGYTGFVGSNIASQYQFTDLYNSANIEKIKGKSYDLIVSAGTTALRWQANLHPRKDWQAIKKLLDCLEKVKAKHFILVSTIDVYPTKDGVDEDTPIKLADSKEAYGRNRFKMEEFVRQHFPKATIARFPQLYGINLKKGFVYDLIHDNALDFTHKDTVMQFYNLANFWKDVQTVIKNKINLINFATPPVSAGELARRTLGMNFTTITQKPPLYFNFTTKYASIFGTRGKYMQTKAQNLSQLKKFIVSQNKMVRQPKLAISNLAWDHKDDAKVIPVLKKYRVQALEVAPSKIWSDPAKTTPNQVKAYKDFWNKNGFEIVATTSLLFGHPELTIFENKTTRQKTLNYLKKMARITHILGAKIMMFGSPKNRKVGDLKPDLAAKIAQDFFTQIADYTKKFGIIFVIEPNPPIYGSDFILTTKQAIALVKKVNHPNFKINLDESALTINKEDNEVVIKQALAHAGHFHISEPFLKPIPTPQTHHTKIARILKKLGYSSWLSIEMPLPKTNLSQLTRTLKFVTSTYN